MLCFHLSLTLYIYTVEIILYIEFYVLFYVSWGLNYYRQPLSVQMGLQTDSLSKADYVLVLDKYIEQIAVIGNNRNFVTAIIAPNIEAVKAFAQQQNISYNRIEDLLENPQS